MDNPQTEEKIAVINWKLPDPWKLRHFEEYIKGREDYKAARRKLKLTFSEFLADFYGSLALCKAGYVTLESVENDIDDTVFNAVKGAMDTKPADLDNLDLALTGIYVEGIGRAVERAVNAPLPDWLKKSSPSGLSSGNIISPTS